MSMRITIAARHKPVVHRPGVACLLPGSDLVVRLFPAKVVVETVTGESVGAFHLRLFAGVTDFTLEQNLESGGVQCWGKRGRDYYRYSLWPLTHGVELKIHKGEIAVDQQTMGYGEPLVLSKTQERLHLGVNKALDWDKVCVRKDIREFLPVWLRLGQIMPSHNELKGNSLLQQISAPSACSNAQAFKDLFCAGFHDIMVPAAIDSTHLGFPLPPLAPGSNPLALIYEGARCIRRLFFTEQEDRVALLPHLLKKIVSGRFTGVHSQFGQWDIEWSKGKMRRAIFHPTHEGELAITLHQGEQRFRIRTKTNQHGINLQTGTPFHVWPQETVFFDRFQR